MHNVLADIQRIAKDNFEAFARSFEVAQRSNQEVISEAVGFAKSSYDEAGKVIEKVLTSGSVDRAMEVSADYTREVIEKNHTQFARFGEIVSRSYSEVCEPFGKVVTKAASEASKKVKNVAEIANIAK